MIDLPDVIRYISYVLFGIGLGFMTITNVIAFKILRTPKKMGFLWWHVTAISLSFVCLGVVAIDQLALRVGEDLTWRAPVVLLGTALFAVAQIIIFSIERQRMVAVQAKKVTENDG